jgi:hypothetical protein
MSINDIEREIIHTDEIMDTFVEDFGDIDIMIDK